MDPAERLRPYVAGLAVAWAQSTPDTRHRSIEGSLAFVDISGFTTLTERLAAKGKIGAEEMSDVLNEKFAQLLEVAYSYGALLVKWGGDAVLLLFEGPDHAALACRAAHEMQRTMRRIGRLQTSVGAVQLRMSVGIHSGSFDFFLVGERHLELLVAGPGATTTAVMEGIAEAGEVLVSPETARHLPQRCLGPEKEAGVLLRSGPPVAPRCRYWPRNEESIGPSRFLDPAIAEHLRVEVGDCEHRQVAIGFVEISGLDELLEQQGPGAAAGALHDLIRVVQEACEHHRVTFWETDISKDGFKILLIAGAPRSSGHDEDAMVRASRAIIDGYAGPVRIRIGVNTGRVFNGAFGPSFRRTWSVKGDAVNLAARVMGKAGIGELLATETLLRRVASKVDADLLPPFTVKGKRHPVRAAVVRRVSTDRVVDSAGASAFIGRRAEMDLLLDAARDAARGRGRGVVITGEPGVGKSRLADHVVNRIGESTTVLRGFGDDYESSTAYYAVRRMLRAAIGHSLDASSTMVADELRRRVRSRCPQLEPWLPLLAVPFDVDLPDTPESASLQEEFRRPRTLSLVVDFLSAVLIGPTVFLCDDVHTADELSAELLSQLATQAAERPWLVLLVGRDAPAAISGNDAVTSVVMAPVSAEEARALVLDTPGGDLLPPHVIREIVDRSEGNPLFLRELTIAVGAADGEELPSTLEELLAAQIDDLAPEARRLLRSVSVLGSRFEESLAEDLTLRPVSPADWTPLDHFLARHADGTRRFRSKLARDAAYEGLPFRRRVELHDCAATALQQRVRPDVDHAEALSLHCLEAQRYDDAWRYACIAGDRARRVYANTEALTFYRRALGAARRMATVPDGEVGRLYERLGDLHARLADLPQATASYRVARQVIADSDAYSSARLALNIALVRARAGSPSIGLRWLTTAEQELARTTVAPQNDIAALRGRILVERAFIRHVQGREAEATRLCREAAEVADRAGADDVLGRALHLSDLVALSAGEPGSDAPVERALSLFERAGDLPRQAGAWNHLGIRAYYAGAWDLAVERYERSRAVHERSGDEWSAAIAAANIGEILVDQGRLIEADPLVTAALRVWRASGTPSDVGFGAALLGRLRCRQARTVEGLGLLTEAMDAYVSKGQRFDIVDVQLRIVEALLLQSAADAAVDRLAEAETTLQAAARAAGMPSSAVPFAADIERLRGVALVQVGQLESGHEHLTRALRVARERSAHDVALSLGALLWAGCGDESFGDEYATLTGRLGIVWAPEFPRARRAADVDLLALLPRQREAAPTRV